LVLNIIKSIFAASKVSTGYSGGMKRELRCKSGTLPDAVSSVKKPFATYATVLKKMGRPQKME
jgi:hypothetical protein